VRALERSLTPRAGQNAGFYHVVQLDNDPAIHGSWELVPYYSEVLAVHAAVLLLCRTQRRFETRT